MNQRSIYSRSIAACALAGGVLLSASGCYDNCWYMRHKWSTLSPIPCPPQPARLGQSVQAVLHQQEANGEALDFVVYEHEFQKNSYRLTTSGEDHIRQIAVRARETGFPVIVEQSSMAVKADTEYAFPIHNDPELDRQRRYLVSQALGMLGVPNADSRVVVGAAPASPAYAIEAESSFSRALNSNAGSNSGFGQGGGGVGGGGFGGGIGGGGGGF